jgi:glucose-6-phosphate 1-dehydrogenase
LERNNLKNNNLSSNDLSAIMVIFGGTGDLTRRKLMPALYNLVYDNLLPEHFAVVSVGRRDKTKEQYQDEILDGLKKYSRNEIKDEYWQRLKERIYYYQFDFTNLDGYADLKVFLDRLDTKVNTGGNRVYYLAVAPAYFQVIVKGLDQSGLSKKNNSWNRLVIEKPFGKDLQTANQLNNSLLDVYSEKDIYRIDHYLGKEMIQNIMVLRFCNQIFESLWSKKYIDNIQITLSEKYGVGTRGGYYEHSGAMRDMVQNHIIQILSLVAMEPPVNLSMDAIRTEKQKVIQAIEEFTPELLRDNVVFGQYGKGIIDGIQVPGYREEDRVPEDSNTETFVALKLHVNNYRWYGTPFYVRTGKRLAMNSAEIVIQFKKLPNILYFEEQLQEPNLLVIRIQPKVGVFFQFNTKDFSTHNDIIGMRMESSHNNPTQGNTPEAYERLIYDILRGDATLFSRWDEVEAAWTLADRIIQYREQKEFNFPNYDAGSMGPLKAFELLAKDGRQWWNI